MATKTLICAHLTCVKPATHAGWLDTGARISVQYCDKHAVEFPEFWKACGWTWELHPIGTDPEAEHWDE